MSEIITVGFDLEKNVFQEHGADSAGRAFLRRKLRRAQVLEFSGDCRPVSWRWKFVAGGITGTARSASWAMKCG